MRDDGDRQAVDFDLSDLSDDDAADSDALDCADLISSSI